MSVRRLPAAFEYAKCNNGRELRRVGEIAVEAVVARERERAHRILAAERNGRFLAVGARLQHGEDDKRGLVFAGDGALSAPFTGERSIDGVGIEGALWLAERRGGKRIGQIEAAPRLGPGVAGFSCHVGGLTLGAVDRHDHDFRCLFVDIGNALRIE